jgi:hypothetical protein
MLNVTAWSYSYERSVICHQQTTDQEQRMVLLRHITTGRAGIPHERQIPGRSTTTASVRSVDNLRALAAAVAA